MFARTPRLTLRPAWPEDAPALAQAIGHEAVVRNLSRVPWPYAEADAAAFIADRAATTGLFCLILSHDETAPAIVGSIGVHPPSGPVPNQDAHELGYWLTPSAWGRGYMTEAGRAVIGMARHALGLKRLSATHYLDNPASGRVLRKLGFEPTGRIVRMPSRARGGEVESAEFALDLLERSAGTGPRLAA